MKAKETYKKKNKNNLIKLIEEKSILFFSHCFFVFYIILEV